MLTLDKSPHAAALYSQLTNQLRDQILAGTLPAGARIPPELELARDYQISRGTVRQAIMSLVVEGWVDRIPGKGTFVRDTAPVSGMQAIAQRRIGVILSYPGGEMDFDVLKGIENAARARSYQVNFACTEETMDHQAHDIARLRDDHVAGLIIFPVRDIEADESVSRLKAAGVPFVLVDRYFADLDCDYVTSDNFGGGYRATQHLIILGHQRVAFAYSHFGTPITTSVRDRLRGCGQALAEYNLSPPETLIVEESRLTNQELREAFIAWLSRPNRASAIFASNDYVASALLQVIQRQGLRVPDDVALVGFDNLSFTPSLNPPLTTVAQSFADMGFRAGNLLLNRIEGQQGASKQVVAPTNLIVRESCGARLRVKATSATS